MLDILLGLSISSSVMALMIAVNIDRALLFASYPSVLLLLTLFRLALSLATTRAILADGEAGQIVQTFGSLVAAGNIVVGLVLFSLVTVVQMLVITKGAERVAEVAARFTLDSMPGRQMSIDADLRAGLASKDDVKLRRDEVQRESELYGALDGAMKFVKGDAIATLIFVIVNIVGGIAIGVLQHGLTFAGALESYTILTIGDGLAAQLPSLLTSITAGFIVSRVRDDSRPGGIGDQMFSEMHAQPRGLIATAILLAAMALVPGLPSTVFLFLAVGLGGWCYVAITRAGSASNQDNGAGAGREGPDGARPFKPGEKIGLVPLRPIVVQHNYDVVLKKPMEAEKKLEDMRLRIYYELGLPLPAIVLLHDPAMPPEQAAVFVNEILVRKFDFPSTHTMVFARRSSLRAIGLNDQAEPALDGDACWIHRSHEGKLAAAGIQPLAPEIVFAEHVGRALQGSASEFLGIQQVREMLASLETMSPDLVREAAKATTIPRAADVLQRLVSEGVSIRDMNAILTALIEFAPRDKDPVALVESVRGHLRRHICGRLGRDKMVVPSFVCGQKVETLIRESIRQTPGGSFMNLTRVQSTTLMSEFRNQIGNIADRGVVPIVLCAPDVRRYVRKLIEAEYPTVSVLSYAELANDFKVQNVGEIRLPDPAARVAAE
jgi:type III secretion protein V